MSIYSFVNKERAKSGKNKKKKSKEEDFIKEGLSEPFKSSRICRKSPGVA